MKNTHGIIIPVLLLIVIGIIMVYSSTALMSLERYGHGFHYLMRHLFAIIIGLGAMLLLMRMDYNKLRVFIIPLLVLSGVLLILVFIPNIGVSAGSGSNVKRWLRLWPSTFQPSELLKIAIVLFLAHYIDRNAWRMKDLRYGIIIPLCVLLPFQMLILLQPDFGAVITLGILTVILLFLGGVRWTYLAGLALLSLPLIYKLILSTPYRRDRLLSFLDPWQDPLDKGFQLVQSFLAFGRGGLTGVGIGDGRQKLFFLPELHTDFIFSQIGEELGLIGASIVLGLFIWLFIKGVNIAMQTEDSFSYYLAMGLTIMIASQAVMNFSVCLGLMPPKGLPLPFISYGGSAILINMVAVGVLMSIQRITSSKPIAMRNIPWGGRPPIRGRHYKWMVRQK